MMFGSGAAVSLLFLVVVTVVFVVVVPVPEVFDPLVVVIAGVTGVVSIGAEVTDVVVDDDAETAESARDWAEGPQPTRITVAPTNETFIMEVIACPSRFAR